MNVEVDRLSNLPKAVINKIFSYSDTKHAIKTSILSSRWKNTWKLIPHLDFSYDHLHYLPKFYESVNHVLSSRNSEIELESIKLCFSEEVSQEFVKKIMDYAFSHNVQKMTIISLNAEKHIEFPLSLFISQSVKDLTLIGSVGSTTITLTWDLLALTTLHLDNIRFINENPGDVFSKCPNMKNLTLTNCGVYGLIDFITIYHPQLSTLIIKNGDWYGVVNVVAPHLKFLTIVNCEGGFMISTPELYSLTYEIQDYFEFSADGLFSLEKVDFHICDPNKADASKIIDVLQQFRNVKCLTLGLEIVEVLASSVQLISHLHSPFANLTSFKIYPANLSPKTKSQLSRMEEGLKKISMPIEVENYLLDGSPNATVRIYSREEMQALENAASAQKVMAEFQMLLEREKIKHEINIARIDQSKAPMETQIDNEKLFKEERTSYIKNCWNKLFKEIEQGGFEIDHIFIKLHEIEDLLKKDLPTSKKDRIQARVSCLRAKAFNVMKLITRSKAALVPVFENELTIASTPSS